MPSAGGADDQSSRVRRRRCAASTSAPYSTKCRGRSRSSTFSRAVRWPVARRRLRRLGRVRSSSVARRRCQHLAPGRGGWDRGRSRLPPGPRRRRSDGLRGRAAAGPRRRCRRAAANWPARRRLARRVITCSIFIASITAALTCAHRSARLADRETMVPCIGVGTAPRHPAGRPRRPRRSRPLRRATLTWP